MAYIQEAVGIDVSLRVQRRCGVCQRKITLDTRTWPAGFMCAASRGPEQMFADLLLGGGPPAGGNDTLRGTTAD
jgi:hypothetical protein